MEQLSPKKPLLLLFDVYGTLLDMALVEKKVNALLNSKRGYAFWFEIFMQYCFVDNCLQSFHPFGDIAKATLQMTARMVGESINENQAEEVLELLHHLPLREDEIENISKLRDLDLRMAALTNAPQEVIESRMEKTGLVSYFEAVLSAETVRKYKPALEVYQWASKKLDVDAKDILFISSHSWDVAGAANAGMQTAYLYQDNQISYPLADTPDCTIAGLNDLCDLLKNQYYQ